MKESDRGKWEDVTGGAVCVNVTAAWLCILQPYTHLTSPVEVALVHLLTHGCATVLWSSACRSQHFCRLNAKKGAVTRPIAVTKLACP
uniref:Secreted protein n=1 Tax=Ascaris lumbricoides TaxID=6252 RepID=A0A0M3IF46_ASCLU